MWGRSVNCWIGFWLWDFAPGNQGSIIPYTNQGFWSLRIWKSFDLAIEVIMTHVANLPVTSVVASLHFFFHFFFQFFRFKILHNKNACCHLLLEPLRNRQSSQAKHIHVSKLIKPPFLASRASTLGQLLPNKNTSGSVNDFQWLPVESFRLGFQAQIWGTELKKKSRFKGFWHISFHSKHPIFCEKKSPQNNKEENGHLFIQQKS